MITAECRTQFFFSRKKRHHIFGILQNVGWVWYFSLYACSELSVVLRHLALYIFSFSFPCYPIWSWGLLNFHLYFEFHSATSLLFSLCTRMLLMILFVYGCLVSQRRTYISGLDVFPKFLEWIFEIRARALGFEGRRICHIHPINQLWASLWNICDIYGYRNSSYKWRAAENPRYAIAVLRGLESIWHHAIQAWLEYWGYSPVLC